MAFHEGLAAHLATGLTTVARAWAVTRRDGVAFGFTDHDGDLGFDGLTYRAGCGMSASALQQGTGLSVDNSEALGVLSDAALSEEDIQAGRYDGAEVVCWLVNWRDLDQRTVLFRGTLGEMTREGGAFRAELRGLTEALNRPMGRIYQAPCPAVLGDRDCGFDTGTAGFWYEGPVTGLTGRGGFTLVGLEAFAEGWFQRGHCRVIDGAAAGLTGMIKRDEAEGAKRTIRLFEELRADLAVGDRVRILAGCDKRFETCRLKFANTLNFRGFPDLPSEDWVAIAPATSPEQGGGSRR